VALASPAPFLRPDEPDARGCQSCRNAPAAQHERKHRRPRRFSRMSGVQRSSVKLIRPHAARDVRWAMEHDTQEKSSQMHFTSRIRPPLGAAWTLL
jgi:hypothetical protein